MHITRLRLIGFKSFVEPTELLVEPGLTGVVGPNGCGKSNLLEALRWVMGETSYKSMRASAMDDVIFSGTNARPARNMAEVSIFIDNSARTAPAEFNDSDEIQITRRIERESGSAYRVNGREVRARDVKILFEDAATGARSPALVRQGQIGEIVNSKPEQRRRILEDAAGTAGLHSRRHEAELRLRGAESNLARLGDIAGQLKSQVESLKRQARQARRYSELSDEIRRAEALQHYLQWTAAQAQVDHDEAALQVALEALGAATVAEASATKQEAELADSLQPLRDQEVTRAAVLARLQHEQTNVDNDVRRAQSREQELAARMTQLAGDVERERNLVEEARESVSRLDVEAKAISTEVTEDDDGDQRLTGDIAHAGNELEIAEQHLSALTGQLNDARARRTSIEATLKDRKRTLERCTSQLEAIDQDLDKAAQTAPEVDKLHSLQKASAKLQSEIETIDSRLLSSETDVAEARAKQAEAAAQRETANLRVNQIETERRTLAALLLKPAEDGPAILDQLQVETGFETALGAALGDDIEAPMDVAGAVHWRSPDEVVRDEDPELPHEARPLADVVTAPAALARRLRQVGIVDADRGFDLQHSLASGQRLVSIAGDLWRWDGLVAPAGAPTAAAQRLAARNRLRELESAGTEAGSALNEATASLESASAFLRKSQQAVSELRETRNEKEKLTRTRAQEAGVLERRVRESEAQQTTLQQAKLNSQQSLDEARQLYATSESELSQLPPTHELEADVDAARQKAGGARDHVATLKATLAARERERQAALARKARLEADRKRWLVRIEQSSKRLEELNTRIDETKIEHQQVAEIPDQLALRRQKLLGELSSAESQRRAAADALAEAEAKLKAANTALREAQHAVSEQREIRARADARLEAARNRRAEIVRVMQETFETAQEGCLAIAELTEDDPLPSIEEADGRLMRLRTDRERLGGVNLQAGEELERLTEQFDTLESERADVEEAIAKLRAGIANLNREGRKRLKEAFETVNRHFRDLFTTLFGGGEASLEMIDDSDDPLAGGLEIIARPPGKKPTTLSLLSGGEQTLTALSLIFAVFLTNPSPICVLDEVDAPLDDANVDRFCTLMEKMAADTDTRFLVITHHPMTMARVDRLFGVTMVERGVSQLVSVDLAAAEGFLEAG